MDVFWIVVVVVLLAALVGYVLYLYMREAGPGSAVLWAAGSRLLRAAPGTSRASSPASQAVQAPLSVDTLEMIDAVATPRPLATGQEHALVVDEAVVRELKEEFQRELRTAVGRSREFDARLTRIEQASGEIDISRELAGVRESQRVEIERLQVTMDTIRKASGAHGERQGQALADLYSHLARVESALTTVINPMLLPGEPLTMPGELPAEALAWASWSDVGERAYAFGNVFNENRLVLDPATSDDIAGFVSTLRQGLTGHVYPAVRSGNPTAEQVAQLRAGLQTIVDTLPTVRRQIETAYREGR